MNQDNSPLTLDPVLAKQLFEKGAVLIVAGVPKGTQFGIDLCAYTIDENFRGVKMIPPGAHFIWCASKGPYGDVAPRVGFVHFFRQNEVLVREWDHDTEELRTRQIDKAAAELECKRLRENLCTLDKFLAPYDYRFVGDWKNLTDAITAESTERCRPALGTIRSNIELQSCPDSERPRGPLKTKNILQRNMDENDLLPNLKPVEGTAPRFSTLPARVPKECSPAEISRHHMDCIAAIEELLLQFSEPTKLIEEVQLCFLFFLAGCSVESLEHWRKILHLLSNSETAVCKYKLLYMKYSEVLSFQLPHLPEELMESTEHNTIYKDVRVLLLNLHLGGLNRNSMRFIKILEKSMQWRFDGLLDDNPEDLPVFVETT